MTKKGTEQAPKPGTKKQPRAKLTISHVLEVNGRKLARARDLTFSDLVADLLARELRAQGLDPYALDPDEKSGGNPRG